MGLKNLKFLCEGENTSLVERKLSDGSGFAYYVRVFKRGNIDRHVYVDIPTGSQFAAMSLLNEIEEAWE